MASGKTPVFSFGTILFALGGVLFFMKVYIGWGTVSATATVSSIRERSEIDSIGNTTYYYDPAIWYVVHSGDTVKTYINKGREGIRDSIGQQIKILYKKENVREFYTASSFWWYVLFGAFFIAGIAVMYFSTKLKSEDWN
jgi:hypothetical protein